MPSNPLLQLMHDAVNPVTTIKSAAKLLKKGGLTPKEIEFLVQGIEDKADELNAVLDAYYKAQKGL